jgi:hypothetical protein
MTALFKTTRLLTNLKLAGNATKDTTVMDFVKDCKMVLV